MLSGEGAAQYGGRWNPKDVKAVYCSENSSLAALEILANLARPSAFPAHNILDLEVPDDAIAVAEQMTDDPQRTGAALLQGHLAIAAPSAVNPLERNVVINPVHPDFSMIAAGDIRPFVLTTVCAVSRYPVPRTSGSTAVRASEVFEGGDCVVN